MSANTPLPAPETTRSCGSGAMPCSPSSDTPETDALWDRIRGSLFWQDHPARLLSEKLERERNYARLQAEIERDKYCHRDHGGFPFKWENERGVATAVTDSQNKQ